MPSISNTQRTLAFLRDKGMVCHKVEYWNPYAGPNGKRIDLFNIIDIVALNKKIIGVQSCGQNFAEHDRKILESDKAPLWLKAGGALVLIGWRKVKKKRGGKQMIWKPRIKWYSLDDFKPTQ